MTIQSVTFGPEKDKGYWQAIANCNHAMAQFVRSHDFSPEEAAEVADLSHTHPVHGAFFEHLAEIYITIEDTYGVSMEKILEDLDSLSAAEDVLLDMYDGQDYE